MYSDTRLVGCLIQLLTDMIIWLSLFALERRPFGSGNYLISTKGSLS